MKKTTNELLALVTKSLRLSTVIDSDGIIRFIGPGASEILELSDQDIVGQHLLDVMPNGKLLDVVKSEKPLMGELFLMKNNEYIVLNRYPIWDETGEVCGAYSVLAVDDINSVSELTEQIARLQKENMEVRQKYLAIKKEGRAVDTIIGESAPITKLKNMIEKIADSPLPVLITGDTGVGKEVFANAIHNSSSRWDQRMVKINCAAIPKDLLESELFGYAPGAFSGAAKDGRKGKFELADGGTILLDEIGDMPLELQSKLLRVLQEKEIERVGSNKTRSIDVRVICSTNKEIKKQVEEGKFRRDLYYRINVVELEIPPLRDRLTDIPLLCEYFIDKFNRSYGFSLQGISEEALAKFSAYSWPGNVRELEHVIEKACVITTHGILEAEDFDFLLDLDGKINSDAGQISPAYDTETELQGSLKDMEREHIRRALEECGGNKSKAAKMLGIDRSVFYRKLNKYGLM